MSPVTVTREPAATARTKVTRRTSPPRAPRREHRRAGTGETGWATPLIWRVGALAIVVLAFLYPRLSDLDRLVTPDEPIWLARSANFYEALSSGDLGSTYQFAHPGVTIMWLGTAGYWWAARDYPDRVDGQISQRQNRIADVLTSQGRDPLDVLVAARTALILGMAVVFALAFVMTLRLLPFWETTLGFLLVALEPFSIGITRLLHVDGLTSVLMLLSVVAGMVYLVRGRQRIDLLVSGIAAGLAVLTRSQMGVLAVWFVVMVVVDAGGWSSRRLNRNSLRRVISPVVVWGAAAFVTCVALWPALWVDPIQVIRGMLDFAETAALEGHERAVFFAGFVYEGDPGWRFYPATFFWRASVVTVAGSAAVAITLVRSRRWGIPATHVRIVSGLLLAAASYGLMMSLAAKKFDRYLLPVYPLIALAGAWAMLQLGRRLGRRIEGTRWAPAAAIGILAVTLQFAATVQSAPYYLSYYSPLLGGAPEAPNSMMVGWGEGLDQIASYLNDLPGSDRLVVSTESWRTPLSYYLEGDAKFAAFVADPPGVFRWANSDYYILYVTPLTRNGVWPAWRQYLQGLTPVMTVNLDGLQYAQLYDIRDTPLPAYMEEGAAGMVVWDGVGRMVASGKSANTGAERGTQVTEILYFDGIEPASASGLETRYVLRLRMVSDAGVTVASDEQHLALRDPIRHGLHWVEQTLQIPANAARGHYRIEMQIVQLDTAAPVSGFSYRFGDQLGEWFQIDSVFVVGSQEELDKLPELIP